MSALAGGASDIRSCGAGATRELIPSSRRAIDGAACERSIGAGRAEGRVARAVLIGGEVAVEAVHCNRWSRSFSARFARSGERGEPCGTPCLPVLVRNGLTIASTRPSRIRRATSLTSGRAGWCRSRGTSRRRRRYACDGADPFAPSRPPRAPDRRGASRHVNRASRPVGRRARGAGSPRTSPLIVTPRHTTGRSRNRRRCASPPAAPAAGA